MGMFSWFTSDNHERIVAGKVKDIYMTGKDGRIFHLKENYEGYGVFGGKDFYEYLAELNGEFSRDAGIKIAFGYESYDSPKLLSNKANIKKANIFGVPEDDPDQGFLTKEDDEYFEEENYFEED